MWRCPGEGLVHTAVLVAERDFEVQDFLARALEAKMARLDNAGVHRPDCDLMHFAAIDAEEFAWGRGLARAAADRLEPRMARGLELVLLPDLALEQVGLRVSGGQGGIFS